jgi:hypothetical protein
MLVPGRRLRRPAHREDEREYAPAGVSLLHVNSATMRQRDLTREVEAATAIRADRPSASDTIRRVPGASARMLSAAVGPIEAICASV